MKAPHCYVSGRFLGHRVWFWAHQEARAKQQNITERLLSGRAMQGALHIYSHFISGKLCETSITPIDRRRNGLIR